MRYKIFAGMGGGYGEAEERDEEFEGTLEEAESYAHLLACEDFEGSQEAPDWDEFVEDVGEEEATEAGFNDYFRDMCESWISYYVEEIK